MTNFNALKNAQNYFKEGLGSTKWAFVGGFFWFLTMGLSLGAIFYYDDPVRIMIKNTNGTEEVQRTNLQALYIAVFALTFGMMRPLISVFSDMF